jgi:predicted nucleotidyltransferase
METSVPAAIQPLIDAYLHALEPLRSHFYGIYIYGSIALDAFEELESDIDIMALTQSEWSSLELKQLKALHTHLTKTYPLGKRLEVFYVPSLSLSSVLERVLV